MPIIWEAEEADGITLSNDGMVEFTNQGLYHVRVRSGEYASDWHRINANEAIPTARDIGTYYVWYMAKGDEMHAPSESKCIEVKIMRSSEEPEIPDKPDSRTIGSSSGGCNSGFSFLGLMLAVLILRRK